jgi:HK97 family phage major capsid protein
MSKIKSKELREKRAQLIAQMEDINKRSDAGGLLSSEDQQQFERLDQEQERLKVAAEREERMADFAAQKEARNVKTDQKPNGEKDAKKEYRAAFARMMRAKKAGDVSREDEKILKEYRGTDTQKTSTTTLGGFLVPEEFSNELEKYQLQFGGMLDAARVIMTGSGADLPWPTVNDTATTGAIITEGTADTVSDLTFASKTLSAYTYTSKVIKVSWELMQDSFFNLENLIAEIAGERLGRALNAHFTTGTGSSQPNGVVTASTLGKTAASATAITRDELVDLLHSVDPAYRMSPNARWMFNDSTLSAIKKLSFGSADDRPLWQPGIQVGEPDRLEGFAYTINQDMASIATGNKTILFGDFSKYVIRMVNGIELVVLRERYADERVNGFFAYQRADGELINTAAVKHLIQA